MKAVKETEIEEATPEQLLQMLDGQLASRRSHRAAANRNRAIILVVGILFIVGAAGAALLVLDQMVSDLRQNGPRPSVSLSKEERNF